MRFVGRGHEAIRATHHKTLELTAHDELTERGTCIVAVGAEADPAAPMAGPVRLRLTVGGERFSLDAVANPSWDPAGPMIVRRSPLRLPGTFATLADAAAVDLPRALVQALADPDALVTVDVRALPSMTPTLVLLLADAAASGPDATLRAELAAADRVISEDADARRLVGAPRDAGAGDGARTLVVATRELPGSTVPELLASAAVVDTVALPPALAAAAACPSSAPLVLGGTADPRALLRSTPARHRLVFSLAHDRLPSLLELAERERGSSAATITQDFCPPVTASAHSLPELPSRSQVHCCLHPVTDKDAMDPVVRSVLADLLADGVPTKTAARAVATLTGWDRRRAYAAVVDWPGTGEHGVS